MKTFAVLLSFTMACGAASQPGESTTASSKQEVKAPRYENSNAAVHALFELMDLESLMGQALEQTIDMQLRQNPQLVSLKPTMMKFLNKYMSWEAISGEMTEMYVDAYSHDELEDLISFYETKTGQKSIKLMPELMTKGAEMGNRRVQEHMAELQEMLLNAMKKQNGGTLPPPQGG